MQELIRSMFVYSDGVIIDLTLEFFAAGFMIVWAIGSFIFSFVTEHMNDDEGPVLWGFALSILLTAVTAVIYLLIKEAGHLGSIIALGLALLVAARVLGHTISKRS